MCFLVPAQIYSVFQTMCWIKIGPVPSCELCFKASSYIFLCTTYSQPFQWSAYFLPSSKSLFLLWIRRTVIFCPSLRCDIFIKTVGPLLLIPGTRLIIGLFGPFYFTLLFFIFSLSASEIKCYIGFIFQGRLLVIRSRSLSEIWFRSSSCWEQNFEEALSERIQESLMCCWLWCLCWSRKNGDDEKGIKKKNNSY